MLRWAMSQLGPLNCLACLARLWAAIFLAVIAASRRPLAAIRLWLLTADRPVFRKARPKPRIIPTGTSSLFA